MNAENKYDLKLLIEEINRIDNIELPKARLLMATNHEKLSDYRNALMESEGDEDHSDVIDKMTELLEAMDNIMTAIDNMPATYDITEFCESDK